MTYFKKEHLQANDFAIIIGNILVRKDVCTEQEFNDMIDEYVEHKNEYLEKELEKSPGMKALFGMMGVKDED